uniref:polynucleotide adenylyltransferase n=1 Tax=Romanomermis culicivorax TaxID=13658 RepID=A0A915JKK6_ROMCU
MRVIRVYICDIITYTKKMKNYHQSLIVANDDRQDENSLYSTSSSTSFSSSVDRSKSLLNQEQIQRLLDVIDDEFEVHGRGNFPTLKVRLSRFIRTLDQRVQAKNLFVKRAKMNGGAASYVLLAGGGRLRSLSVNQFSLSNKSPPIKGCDFENGNVSSPENLYKDDSAQRNSLSSSSNDNETFNDQSFGDVDLIFDVDLTPSTNFDLFKQCALETLIEFLPEDANRSKITDAVMQDAYVKKMVKIGGYYNSNSQSGKKDVNNYRCKQQQLAQQQSDLWSLITLNNDQGRCIELKFVDRIKRQFEFSVDSFQIHLDWLLYLDDDFDDHKMSVKRYLEQNERLRTMKIVAESVYGDFQLALKHLNEKLIDTIEPELIRGGGLLKYVHLLIK